METINPTERSTHRRRSRRRGSQFRSLKPHDKSKSISNQVTEPRRRGRSRMEEVELVTVDNTTEVVFECNCLWMNQMITEKKEYTGKLKKRANNKLLRNVKKIPLEIMCTVDSLLIRPVAELKDTDLIHTNALYRDIQGVLLYKTNTRDFVVCYDDPLEDGQRYYNSYHGSTPQDVIGVCQLISKARASKNFRLDDGILEDVDLKSIEFTSKDDLRNFPQSPPSLSAHKPIHLFSRSDESRASFDRCKSEEILQSLLLNGKQEQMPQSRNCFTLPYSKTDDSGAKVKIIDTLVRYGSYHFKRQKTGLPNVFDSDELLRIHPSNMNISNYGPVYLYSKTSERQEQ